MSAQAPWTADAAEVPDEISSDEVLHRRVPPYQYKYQEGRPAALAFWARSNPHQISVDRAFYRNPSATLEGSPGFGLAAMTAATAQEITAVAPAPEKLLENPAHANIIVDEEVTPKRIKATVCRQLAKACSMIVVPEQQ